MNYLSKESALELFGFKLCCCTFIRAAGKTQQIDLKRLDKDKIATSDLWKYFHKLEVKSLIYGQISVKMLITG